MGQDPPPDRPHTPPGARFLGVDRSRLVAQLRDLGTVTLDTSVLIYHLEDIKPYSELTEEIFGTIAGGTVQAILSTITVAELLVKPFQSGDVERVELCERFLLSFPHADLAAPDDRIAREAARIRATYRVRTPDAIFLATALVHEAPLISNDHALKRLWPKPAPILILDDFV